MSGYNVTHLFGHGRHVEPPVVSCPTCGVRFQMQTRNHKYCCKRCKEEAYRKAARNV